MEINIPNHTYSVFVKAPESQEKVLANNFLFRSEQISASYLDTLVIAINPNSTPGYVSITNFEISNNFKSASCQITGPNRLKVNETGSFKVSTTNAPQGGSIHFTLVNSNNLCDGNNWRDIRSKQSDGETNYSFSTPGTCLIVCNAYNNTYSSSSGNPGTSTQPNCGWLDCG